VIEVDAPRRNGELVFDEPWQARAFGLCVALLEAEGLTWDAFKPHLIAAIEAAPALSYYENFAVALEAFAQPWVEMPPSTGMTAPVK
jgi:hypothetical protein